MLFVMDVSSDNGEEEADEEEESVVVWVLLLRFALDEVVWENLPIWKQNKKKKDKEYLLIFVARFILHGEKSISA